MENYRTLLETEIPWICILVRTPFLQFCFVYTNCSVSSSFLTSSYSKKMFSGCINLSFAYVEGESLLMALKDVALSSGSACTSASLEPSYVLRAIGTDEDLAHSSIR